MGQKYCVNNNSHTSEPDKLLILLIRITGKNDRQTSGLNISPKLILIL